ncbi:uncharacterized protein CC84DRAFT_795003 [Paraphaeosphaeria sporulosa]|uniref:Uncharacterized protein n=1 Tax=Paraphaeosphaeria sporulosa TaxID=1460663 RepID=A0A177CB12_9PLEO|nr:uncharacterized protein CC84DRAFT_795003 [Paraphaeosphaeria sporulosa]OAG04526.1 hypothetical protein CC84DRAFT_795003 [Paraphaeosphaeria sporulosa]
MKVMVKAYHLALSRLAILYFLFLNTSSYTHSDHGPYCDWQGYWKLVLGAV